MRIIIKPLGLVVVLTAFVCVALLPKLFPTKSSPQVTAKATVTRSKSTLQLKDENWEAYQDAGASINATPMKVKSSRLKHAVRFDVINPGEHPWSVGYHNRITGNFSTPMNTKVRFWARATAKREITIVTQPSVAPFTPDSVQNIALTTEWKEYTAPLAVQSHPEDAIFLSIQLGHTRDSVEIADIRLIAE